MHHLVLLALLTGCGVTLPGLYVRGTYTLGHLDGVPSEVTSAEVGLAGALDAPPAPIEAEAPLPTPPRPSALPCRVSIACSWERRAAAEARARVIGARP